MELWCKGTMYSFSQVVSSFAWSYFIHSKTRSVDMLTVHRWRNQGKWDVRKQQKAWSYFINSKTRSVDRLDGGRHSGWPSWQRKNIFSRRMESIRRWGHHCCCGKIDSMRFSEGISLGIEGHVGAWLGTFLQWSVPRTKGLKARSASVINSDNGESESSASVLVGIDIGWPGWRNNQSTMSK